MTTRLKVASSNNFKNAIKPAPTFGGIDPESTLDLGRVLVSKLGEGAEATGIRPIKDAPQFIVLVLQQGPSQPNPSLASELDSQISTWMSKAILPTLT